jgi:hypothetical protein
MIQRETPDSIQSCVEKTPNGLFRHHLKMDFRLLGIYPVFILHTMNHPTKIAKHEGKKIGEAAAGGVAATAVCSGAQKVLAPCLEEAVPVAVPVLEGMAEDA